MCHCVCHRTEESYDYENSIEKADDERQAEKDKKYEEYSKAHNGRVCLNHMYFDERTREWRLNYEPQRCARICYSQNGWCPVLDRRLSRKKANVYYDLKTSHIRKDGTLFDGEVIVHIEKGIRYFERPVCMDICEAFIRQNGKEIIWNKYKWNTYTTIKLFDPTFQAEILNVRAESRPSRDLMQDLADIQEGINISHSSDLVKCQKEAKRERRQRARTKRIEKLEAKILKNGYGSLENYSLDKIHADKWLTPERIEELEKLRLQRIKEEQEQPVQMNLFD
ncbi:sarcolemmal membrane-associated protein [Hungatella hathewayi]|nr:sarcolemmal membrane-associated protein [Hungatella hathewayi]